MLLTSRAHLVSLSNSNLDSNSTPTQEGHAVALSREANDSRLKGTGLLIRPSRDHIVGKLGLDDGVAPGRRAAELLQLRILARHDDAGHADALRSYKSIFVDGQP